MRECISRCAATADRHRRCGVATATSVDGNAGDGAGRLDVSRRGGSDAGSGDRHVRRHVAGTGVGDGQAGDGTIRSNRCLSGRTAAGTHGGRHHARGNRVGACLRIDREIRRAERRQVVRDGRGRGPRVRDDIGTRVDVDGDALTVEADEVTGLGVERAHRIGRDLARRVDQRRNGQGAAVEHDRVLIGSTGRPEHVGVEDVPFRAGLVPCREAGQRAGGQRGNRVLYHTEHGRGGIRRIGTRTQRVADGHLRDGGPRDRHRRVRLRERAVRPVRIRAEVVRHLGFVDGWTSAPPRLESSGGPTTTNIAIAARERETERQLVPLERAHPLMCPSLDASRHFAPPIHRPCRPHVV